MQAQAAPLLSLHALLKGAMLLVPNIRTLHYRIAYFQLENIFNTFLSSTGERIDWIIAALAAVALGGVFSGCNFRYPPGWSSSFPCFTLPRQRHNVDYFNVVEY